MILPGFYEKKKLAGPADFFQGTFYFQWGPVPPNEGGGVSAEKKKKNPPKNPLGPPQVKKNFRGNLNPGGKK